VPLVGDRRVALIVLLFLFVVFVFSSEIKIAEANPLPSPPFIGMPEEYINVTISFVNGTLWAKVDGTYPLFKAYTEDVFLLDSDGDGSGTLVGVVFSYLKTKYPIPPNATNISVKMNETYLRWTRLPEEDIYQTYIGDYQYINWTIDPIREYFVIKTHYEHPLNQKDGNYIFLYPLITGPYVKPGIHIPEYNTSTAHFNINLEVDNFSTLQVDNIRSNRQWILHGIAGPLEWPLVNGLEYDALGNKTWTLNQVSYEIDTEDSTKTLKFDIISEIGKPVPGDFTVAFTNPIDIPEFPSWILLPLFLVVTFVVIVVRKRLTC
jgi:hypothetical protein